jgi:hypothetical protein
LTGSAANYNQNGSAARVFKLIFAVNTGFLRGFHGKTVSTRTVAQGVNGVNSVVSLRTFANASNVPMVDFVDMQQEYVAAPRLMAIFGIDRALHNCRKVLDHARRTGLPMLADFAGESSCLSTLVDAFHRNHKVTYLCDASASQALEDVSADASTLPRKLGIGKNAGD